MTSARSSKRNPFQARKALPPASHRVETSVMDVNHFYTIPSDQIPQNQSPPKQTPSLKKQKPRAFLQKTPRFPASSSLQNRYKAKSKRRIQRAGFLGLFLILVSVVLWYLGSVVIDTLEERLNASPIKTVQALSTPTQAITKNDSLNAIHLPHYGISLPFGASQQIWESPTSFRPMIRPSLSPAFLDADLQTRIEAMCLTVEPRLRPHILVLDGQTFQFAGKRISEAVSAASVIKLPLLYLYTLHLNEGILQNETLAYFGERHLTEGSGSWQFEGIDRYYNAFQTAEAMIQTSDNSATELMIELLGHRETVNEHFKALGLQKTKIANTLPDLEGLNTISPYEMVTTLFNLKENPIFNTPSKSTAMEILEGTQNRRLIPALLPADTLVAHKTGDIGKSLGETALVYLPDGRYYYISIMVERPHNDGGAKDFIQRLSRTVWDYYQAKPTAFKASVPLETRHQSTGGNTPAPDLRQGNINTPDAEVF
jgi:beta-lactamase class A